MPSPMLETSMSPRPPNPSIRLEKKNILPLTMGKMTARRVFNWPRLCTSRNSENVSIAIAITNKYRNHH
jgi:hypothetical protein